MIMSAQTVTTERRELHQAVDALPDAAIPKLADYIKWLEEEAEIAALEAKHWTTPNAETIAAMKELDEGGGEVISMDTLKAMLDEIR
jgi:hypothetical protein